MTQRRLLMHFWPLPLHHAVLVLFWHMTEETRVVMSRVFSSALVIRDPSWFNETWLARIKEESGDNWRLKATNDKFFENDVFSIVEND